MNKSILLARGADEKEGTRRGTRKVERAYGALDELALDGGERGHHAEAPLIEHVHGHLEAVALAAEHVLDRHAAVLEVHLCTQPEPNPSER